MELTPLQTAPLLAAVDPRWQVGVVTGDRGGKRLHVAVAAPWPVVVTVAPPDDDPDAWAVVHQALPGDLPPQAGADVLRWCRAAEAALREAGARWPVAAKVPDREVAPFVQLPELLGDEWPLLQPWLAFAAEFGAHPPRIWVQREPAFAVLLEVPPVPPRFQSAYSFVHAVTAGLASAAHVPTWLQQLGFGCDTGGHLTTVPTPAGFVRLVTATLGRGPAFVPQLWPVAYMLNVEKPWLHAMVRGRALLNVPPPGFADRTRWMRHPRLARHSSGLRRLWHGQLVIAAHDLTVHCMLQHRIPHGDVAALARPIARVLGRLTGPFVPKPLAAFYEDDLPRHCQDLWRQCFTPSDFDVLWPRELPKLIQTRAARIASLGVTRRLWGWLPGG